MSQADYGATLHSRTSCDPQNARGNARTMHRPRHHPDAAASGRCLVPELRKKRVVLTEPASAASGTEGRRASPTRSRRDSGPSGSAFSTFWPHAMSGRRLQNDRPDQGRHARCTRVPPVRRRGCERGTRHREQACRCVLRRPEAQSGTGFERSGLPGRINVGAVALPVGSAAQGGVADRSRSHGMHACRTRRHLRGRPRKCGCWSLSRQIPGVFPEHPQWVTPKGAGRRDSNGWNSEIEDQCKSKGPAVIERIRYAPEARRR